MLSLKKGLLIFGWIFDFPAIVDSSAYWHSTGLPASKLTAVLSSSAGTNVQR